MKKILVVDGVNNETEEFETVNEAKSWIKECFIDKDEGIHPDIESVKIYEQKYITDVVEAEDGYKVTFNEIESVPAETLVMPKINGRCNTCKKEIKSITEHEKFYYKTQAGNFKMVICCFDCQLQLTSSES